MEDELYKDNGLTEGFNILMFQLSEPHLRVIPLKKLGITDISKLPREDLEDILANQEKIGTQWDLLLAKRVLKIIYNLKELYDLNPNLYNYYYNLLGKKCSDKLIEKYEQLLNYLKQDEIILFPIIDNDYKVADIKAINAVLKR